MATLNDIKKQSLILLNANGATDLYTLMTGSKDFDVDTITDEQYTQYLVNMIPSINRALSRIERAGVLPVARCGIRFKALASPKEDDLIREEALPSFDGEILSICVPWANLTKEEKEMEKNRLKALGIVKNDDSLYIDISVFLSSFSRLVRVDREFGTFTDPDVDYMRQGNTIILPLLRICGEGYWILYEKRIARISPLAPSSTVIDIPDELAGLIPYYVKSELFEEEEPSLAVQARNYFESELEVYKRDDYGHQSSVVDVFGGLL